MPGGKPNHGESDLECLCREVGEELSGTQIRNIRSYGNFEGMSPHRREHVLAKVYLADVDGGLYGPSSEISKSKFSNSYVAENISYITAIIVRHLRDDGYL